MERAKITDRLRRYGAAGASVVALAGGVVSASEARPADRLVESFPIYPSKNIQYLNFYEDPSAANLVLNEANFQNAIKDAAQIITASPEMSVNFKGANGSYDLEFTLSRLVDQQLHNIHLVANEAAANTEAPLDCAPVWISENPFESTNNCTLDGELETYMMPAPEDTKSLMWPGTDPDVLTLAKAACHNVFDTDFSQAQIDPLYGGQANGKYGEVRDVIRYLACEGFSGAVAAKTAGRTYDQYTAMSDDNVVDVTLGGKIFKVNLPVFPRSAWTVIESVQFLPIA